MTASDGAPGNGRSLEVTCRPMVEKGTHTSACAPVTTPAGQTVQVQEFRNEFGKFLTSAGKRMDGAGTTAYFPRVDGSIVQADLSIAATPEATVTLATHDRAESLVADFRNALVSYAADPKVGPAPGPATGPPAAENPGRPTQHDQNQAYLQEALGSPTFGLYDSVVTLEPNKGAYQDLPSPYFSGTASLVRLTQAQFDAACAQNRGFGEGAAYYVRPDGTIVVATISLRSSRVTKANRDEQVNGTLAWLEGFQDELIAAVTDSRMAFDT